MMGPQSVIYDRDLAVRTHTPPLRPDRKHTPAMARIQLIRRRDAITRRMSACGSADHGGDLQDRGRTSIMRIVPVSHFVQRRGGTSLGARAVSIVLRSFGSDSGGACGLTGARDGSASRARFSRPAFDGANSPYDRTFVNPSGRTCCRNRAMNS